MHPLNQQQDHQEDRDAGSIFLIFLKLGLTSFGGPIAHLSYFRDEFVTRRQWLSERAYADLVALCQFLPGPASSQVGIALGLIRAGYSGALAAWAGFTLPSAILLMGLGLGLTGYGNGIAAGALQGLKIVAVAVVAQAVWGMARSLCPDRPRVTLMAGTACVILLTPSAWAPIGVIVASGVIGLLWFQGQPLAGSDAALPVTVQHWVSVGALVAFFALLVGLPVLAHEGPSSTLAFIDAFYRSGSLVFGGGHVVLPLLQAEVVHTGWVSNATFLAGYGLAQAMPGPLFTFAALLGAAADLPTAPTGWRGGLIALLAIFLPAFLLVLGALPFWERLRRAQSAQAALAGINAAVVGILLAALYHPVWTSAIHSPPDFGLALLALVALMFWALPPWLVVAGCGLIGGLFLSP